MKIQIVEVGPRDGLQNESTPLSVEIKKVFVERLARAGVQRIEAGAFVSPKWVPQMADSAELFRTLMESYEKEELPESVRFSALVPNEKGMQEALLCRLKEVSVFAAASETFSRKNINCSIQESFERFEPVFALAKKNKIKVRGYLSTCFYCPYEGRIEPKKVIPLIKRLFKMGATEVSVGDTIGAAHPKEVRHLLKLIKPSVGLSKIAMHFHDTRGTAIANILASLEMGVSIFDASLGGLGGCPYAPGAAGNVSTEDVLYMLHGMGYKTGIDLEALIEISRWMSVQVKHELPSRVAKAGVFKTKTLKA